MLVVFAWISLILAVICGRYIRAYEFKHPQKMGIMNVVWPVSALYFVLYPGPHLTRSIRDIG